MKRVLFTLLVLQLFVGKASAQMNLSLDPDSMSLDSFNQEILSEYQKFRDQVNGEYAKFMEEVWKSYPIEEAKKVPEEKQLEPVVYDKEKDEQYLAEKKRLEEEQKLAEEKKQREEEQQKLAEQQKQQEQQQKQLAEQKQQQEQQQKQLAEQQKQQEEQQRLLAEEKEKQQKEQQQLAEDQKKQQEEQQRLAQEKQNQEQEQQRLAAEQKKQQEELQRLAQEKQKQQEQQQKILADQKKQQEELQRLQEEKKKQEQERQQLLAERKKLEAEQKQLAEQKKQQEEQQKLLEQQKKQDELKKLLAEKKKKEEEERLLAEKQKQQEQQQKAIEEQQKKQAEQQRLLEEQQKKQEEQQRLLAEQQKKQEEQQRLIEEKQKKQQQEQQLLAEKKKQQEEKERLLAEKKRKQEEQQRILEEKKQKQLEQQQALAEKKKQQEEQQRQLAEKQKQQEEQQRQLAEKQKQQEEQQRILAEKKKQQEERERQLAEEKKKQEAEKSKPIVAEVIPQPEKKEQPKPIGGDVKRPEMPPKNVATTNSFEFYGTPMGVRWGKVSQFKLKGNDEKAFAAGYRELTSAAYNDLLDDCIRLRKEKNLCDWAYYKMLQSLSEAACGKGTNEAVFLQGVLLSQSGYQMRFAYEDNHKLHLLSRINGFAYNCGYFVDNGKLFYLLDGSKAKSLHICEAKFDKEQGLDLDNSLLPDLKKDMSSERRIVSNFVKVAAMTSVNKNMINFFNDYPISGPGQGKDVTLKWFKYGNLPMTKEVKDKLYPQLKEKIQNAPKVMAANMLLSWVQYGLEYMLDEKVWGHDRPFFAEESLYYPYADCEDRAILFSQLVRDLLDLDVVLVYNANPGHLYTAICFNQEVPGDYIMVNGKKFTVADPTYYGANVGKTMNRMNNSTAKVLLLNKNRKL